MKLYRFLGWISYRSDKHLFRNTISQFPVVKKVTIGIKKINLSSFLQIGIIVLFLNIIENVNKKSTTALKYDDKCQLKLNLQANVFVTDAILATLMCATRSAYSWDIVVDKIGGKVGDG